MIHVKNGFKKYESDKVTERGRAMDKNIAVYNNHTGIAQVMKPLFSGEKMHLQEVEDYDRLLQILQCGDVHLLITDIVMGTEDILPGLQCIRKIRSISSVPVIVVSDRKDETTKILALEAGADDYVVYGCNPLVILARVKSQLRRYLQTVNLQEKLDSLYRVGGLEIDDNIKRVTVDKKEVRLTPIEYQILRLLVKEKGRVLSTPEIYESIWHMQAIGADNTIAVHVRHIREKIEPNPKDPRYLKVVWGNGYKVG